MEFKEAKSNTNIIPFRDNVIVKGTLNVSILEIVNKELDKGIKFSSLTIDGYGNMAIPTNIPIDLGTEIVLGTKLEPNCRIDIDTNDRSLIQLNNMYAELAKSNNKAYIEATKVNDGKVNVIEYFIVPIHYITAYNNDTRTK